MLEKLDWGAALATGSLAAARINVNLTVLVNNCANRAVFSK